MNCIRLSLLLVGVASVAVAAEKGIETRGIAPRQEGLKVIEEKCLVCHNRQRIDNAIKDRRAVEGVLRGMEKKGVVLSTTERSVIGHFWGQNPFRGGKGKPIPPKDAPDLSEKK